MGMPLAFKRKAEARDAAAQKQWGREGGGVTAQRPLAGAGPGGHAGRGKGLQSGKNISGSF